MERKFIIRHGLEWQAIEGNCILEDNELACAKREDGSICYKLGDGKTKWTELPELDYIPDRIVFPGNNTTVILNPFT